jgi:hypothetical protein
MDLAPFCKYRSEEIMRSETLPPFAIRYMTTTLFHQTRPIISVAGVQTSPNFVKVPVLVSVLASISLT